MSQQTHSQHKTETTSYVKEGAEMRSNEPKDSKDFKKGEEKFMEKAEKFDDKKASVKSEFKSSEKTTILESQPPQKVKAVAEVTIPVSTEKESKF